ncbi:MAG: hypothetical protein ACTSQI_06090 [Candidatus Helarchaeota archaeon]
MGSSWIIMTGNVFCVWRFVYNCSNEHNKTGKCKKEHCPLRIDDETYKKIVQENLK